MTDSKKQLTEKLTKDLDVTDWKSLHHHFVRDNLFLVHETLDFVDACVDVAQDNQSLVNNYIQEGQIRRPDGLEVEKWHKEKPLFKCLVVSPFVFIQLTDISLKKKED
ncbi:MAG: DUF2288 family protein [Lentisphaeraceae bacterium]|nr:DUF2288 family protein [Lentisphaeraceae bacterium]